MAKHIPYGERQDRPGENRVFDFLKTELPDSYTLWTNFLFPSKKGEEREVDLVVTGPCGIYVIEMKDFDGRIVVRPDEWVLSNGKTEKPPFEQARSAMFVVKDALRRFYVPLETLYFDWLVCLAGENPRCQFDKENPQFGRKIIAYRNLPEFFKRVERQARQIQTQELLLRAEQAFEEHFFVPWIPSYYIEGGVRFANGYRMYSAIRKTSPYKCVLKVYTLPIGTDKIQADQLLEQLRREIDALKTIRDEGDPRVEGKQYIQFAEDAMLDNNATPRYYAVALQWVDGELLSDVLLREDFKLKEKYRLAAQFCRGLAFVHSADVIHRNLRIDNLLLSRKDNIIKIIDFDLARFRASMGRSDTIRWDGPSVRTYLEAERKRHYLAPELRPVNESAQNAQDLLEPMHQANQATDIYAAGIVLWELFSGRLDFNGEWVDEEALRLLDQVNLDPQIKTWIRQMIARDPEERQVNLLDLAQRLEELAMDSSANKSGISEIAPHTSFGGYEFLETLASTKLSQTYLARHELTERKVVIKFLYTDNVDVAAKEARRVQQLARLLLPSDCTAEFLDAQKAYQLNGRLFSERRSGARPVFYQVWEYLPGKSLDQCLNETINNTDLAIKLAQGVVFCVQCIHQADWVHMDIKPANFLVGEKDQRVRIIDFGLSCLASEAGVPSHVSPGYLPPNFRTDDLKPEQRWTKADDVYQTASVVMALLCGEYADPCLGPVKDFERLITKIPEGLVEWLRRSLSDEVTERYADACEMFQALQSLLHFDEEEPMNDYTVERVQTWIRELQQRAEDPVCSRKERARFFQASDDLEAWLQNGLQGEQPIQAIALVEELLSPSQTQVADQPGITPLGEDSTMKPTVSADSFDDGESFSVGAEEKDQQRIGEQRKKIEELMGRALDAESQQDYGGALDSLAKILALDAEYKDALQLKAQIEKKREEERFRNLEHCLRFEEDDAVLDRAVRDAEALIRSGQYPHLEPLYIDARKRRDEARVKMGQLTTADALQSMQQVSELIKELEKKINLGHKTAYDARVGESRPIDQVLSEARSKLPDLVVAYGARMLSGAAGYMPGKPMAALQHIEQALQMAGIDAHEPTHEELKNKRDEYQLAVQKWQEADQIVQSSRQEVRPLAVLRLLREARQIYPGYEQIDQKIEAQQVLACADLAERLRQAIHDGTAKLAGEEQELAEQAGSLAALQTFDQARQLVMKVREDLALLLPEQRTEDLKVAIREADEFLAFVQAREERRSRLRAAYQNIQTYIQRRNFNAAKKAYENLTIEEKSDFEIRSLYEQLQQYFDDEEKLKQAQEFFNQGNWSQAYSILRELCPEGELKKRIEDLKQKVEIYGLQQDIERYWQQGRYQKAQTLLNSLKAYETTAGKLVADAKQQLRFEEKQREIERRQVVDQQHRIVPLYEEIKKQFEELREQMPDDRKQRWATETVPEREKLRQLMGLAAKLKELAQLETTRQGEFNYMLRGVVERVRVLAVQRLRHLKEQNSDDWQEAFEELADKMQPLDLNLPEEIDLCKWAARGYCNHYTRQVLKGRVQESDLRKLVQKYEKMVAQYSGDLEIREGLFAARQYYWLWLMDDRLLNDDEEQAQQIREQPEAHVVFQSNVPWNKDTADDPQVRLRELLIQALRSVRKSFQSSEYLQAVEMLRQTIEEAKKQSEQVKAQLQPEQNFWHRLAVSWLKRLLDYLARYLEKLNQQAIADLLNRANEAGQNANLAERVRCYAQVLSLNENHPIARSGLQADRHQVEVQIRSLTEAAEQFYYGAGILEQKLQEAQELDRQLVSMQIACPLINLNPATLSGARQKIAEVIQTMLQCQKLLHRWDENGADWRRVLLNGLWQQVEQDLSVLRGYLPDAHPQVHELQARLSEQRVLRQEIERAKDELQSYLLADSFTSIIEHCKKLKKLLKGRPDESFGLLPATYQWRDDFLNQNVPFWGDSNQFTICSLAGQRLETYQKWKAVWNELEHEYKKIFSGERDEDEDFSTYVRHQFKLDVREDEFTLLKLEDLRQQRKTISGVLMKYEQDKASLPPPDSRKALGLSNECEAWCEDLRRAQNVLDNFIKNVEQYEKRIVSQIDQAAVDLTKRRLDLEMQMQERIDVARRFYEQSKAQDMLAFLDRMQTGLDRLRNDREK